MATRSDAATPCLDLTLSMYHVAQLEHAVLKLATPSTVYPLDSTLIRKLVGCQIKKLKICDVGGYMN